jgi:hypothetical protein
VGEAKRALPGRFKDLRRNQDWGERPMALAWANPQKPNGQTRPVMEAVWELHGWLKANFDRLRANYRVDPDVGNIIER